MYNCSDGSANRIYFSFSFLFFFCLFACFSLYKARVRYKSRKRTTLLSDRIPFFHRFYGTGELRNSGTEWQTVNEYEAVEIKFRSFVENFWISFFAERETEAFISKSHFPKSSFAWWSAWRFVKKKIPGITWKLVKSKEDSRLICSTVRFIRPTIFRQMEFHQGNILWIMTEWKKKKEV